MRKIIFYLIAWLFLIGLLLISPNLFYLPNWYIGKLLYANCAYLGALGGVLYCIRAVYLNKCAYKSWDADWEVWYYLRPITSTITGLMSSIFLKAGLLALQASNGSGEASFGYLAVAFIAGFNVDNFLKKIESVTQAALGVQKSRASDLSEKPSDKGGDGNG